MKCKSFIRTIEERRAAICLKLRTVMQEWDAAEQNPNSTMQELAVIQLKIDGLCRELDALKREEEKKKA